VKSKFWTDDRINKLDTMLAAGKSQETIAAELGCTRFAVRHFIRQRAVPVPSRYLSGARRMSLRLGASGERPPEWVLDARDNMLARMAGMSLTAILMGDPPPGRSALDQMRER